MAGEDPLHDGLDENGTGTFLTSSFIFIIASLMLLQYIVNCELNVSKLTHLSLHTKFLSMENTHTHAPASVIVYIVI